MKAGVTGSLWREKLGRLEISRSSRTRGLPAGSQNRAWHFLFFPECHETNTSLQVNVLSSPGL